MSRNDQIAGFSVLALIAGAGLVAGSLFNPLVGVGVALIVGGTIGLIVGVGLALASQKAAE